MDFTKADHWDNLMNKLQLSSEEEDLEGFINKTRQLLEKKSRLYWHSKFFDRYRDNNINPWGLRVQVFPNIRDPSSDFKRKWEKVLIRCSDGLMELLLEHHLHDIEEIQKELDVLSMKSNHFKTNETFESRNKDLNDHMEKFNKHLIQSKLKKFDKDLRAFKEGRAYSWYNTSGNFRSRTRLFRNDIPSDQSYSSSGSDTETCNSDTRPPHNYARHHTFHQQNPKMPEKKVIFNEGGPSSSRPEPNKGKSTPAGSKKKESQPTKSTQKLTQMAETLLGPAGSTRHKTQGGETSKSSTASPNTIQTTLSYTPKDKEKEREKEKDKDVNLDKETEKDKDGKSKPPKN